MTWQLRLHGVGNASAVELGSAMATIERDGAPWLTIDCGAEGLTAFETQYGRQPEALFWTFLFPIVISVVLAFAFPSSADAPVIAGIRSGPGADAVSNGIALRDLKRGRADIDPTP